MRPLLRHLAVLAAAAAALVPIGCGSSDEPEGEPLPRAAAAELAKRLDEVQRRFDNGTTTGNVGACEDIEKDSFKAIDSIVGGLPREVDPEVRTALERGIDNLERLTREGCSGVEPTPTEPEPPPPPPTPQPTIPEETTPEETETEKEPEEKEDKPKEDKKEKDDQGGGGGTPAPGGGAVPPQGQG